MHIGESFFQTTNRGLAACLGCLGFPLKKNTPIINNYSERKPVPKFPFGHPKWYYGTLLWRYEMASETCESAGKSCLTNKITREFYNGTEAKKLDDYVKVLDDAVKGKDIAAIGQAWLKLKDAMPYILAGHMGFHEANRERIVMPLLKLAYDQEKKTGLSIDIVSVSEDESEVHTGKNPSEVVKEKLL